MATGTIAMPYDAYKEYTLSKEADATNWTLIRSHACRQGKTAFVQLVVSVTADQDSSSVRVVQLPSDLTPLYNWESRFTSGEQGSDYNVTIGANRYIAISRSPANTSGNVRIDAVFPIA